SPSTQEPAVAHAPRNGKNKKIKHVGPASAAPGPRRQSRTTSEYFNISVSPISSRSSGNRRSGLANQPTPIPTRRMREKSRRRQKGTAIRDPFRFLDQLTPSSG